MTKKREPMKIQAFLALAKEFKLKPKAVKGKVVSFEISAKGVAPAVYEVFGDVTLPKR